MELTLQEHIDANLPTFKEGQAAQYHPIYLQSKDLYEALQEDNGPLSATSLANLSPAALEELRTALDSVVIPKLRGDLQYYSGNIIASNDYRDSAANYANSNPHLQDSLALGIINERFAHGTATIEEIKDAVTGAIDDFEASTHSAIQAALEIKQQIPALAQELASNEVAGLDANQDKINALAPEAREELRRQTQELLDANKAEAPENAPRIEAFEQLLDTRVAPMPAPAAEVSSSTAPPAWSVAPPSL